MSFIQIVERVGSQAGSFRKEKRLELLKAHVEQLLACRTCPRMQTPAVSGGPVLSKVMLIGQAPGDKEPVLGKPFAWTAGRTLFGWFAESCGITEATFRATIYMGAVCRCFPGKKPAGGDRVPTQEEIANCARWLQSEMKLLQPELVIPVGRLAIEQFVAFKRMEDVIGRQMHIRYAGHCTDLIPLPHPSGASPWHRIEPGMSLLKKALGLIASHPAIQGLQD